MRNWRNAARNAGLLLLGWMLLGLITIAFKSPCLEQAADYSYKGMACPSGPAIQEEDGTLAASSCVSQFCARRSGLLGVIFLSAAIILGTWLARDYLREWRISRKTAQ